MTIIRIDLPSVCEERPVEKKISDSISLPILPVSPRFFNRHDQNDFTDSVKLFGTRDEESLDDEVSDDEDEDYLSSLDPKTWKEQDHYKVLGLSDLRYKADDEDIKKAYRKKVLKHHPDKKAAISNNADDDAIFKCIQKAWETLTDPVKRRQFDSVDPGIDDDSPDITTLEIDEEFYEEFGPVFERESRFSKIHPVLGLGGHAATKEDVEAFYDFWYNFDSWRSFEYFDKEDADGADSRDDKRYLDKKNKAERAKRKKEDNARLRKIVDLALRLDPRIKYFRQAEKAAKEAKKWEKERAVREAKEAAAKKAEEERLAKEAEEAAAKEVAAAAKKDKEERKKVIRKERKTIKNMVVKDYNYFWADGETVPVKEVEKVLSMIEFMFEKLETPEMLEIVRIRLEEAKEGGKENIKRTFEAQHAELKADSSAISAAAEKRAQEAKSAAAEAKKKVSPPWGVKEIKALIKSANVFPGGTVNRWEKISEYISLHSGEPQRTIDDIIKMSAEVKKGTAFDAASLNILQTEKRHHDTLIKDSPTVRDPADAVPVGAATNVNETNGNSESSKSKKWTPGQQIQLQKALQKFPPSYKGADRWDKIAALVEGKTKKECMLRVKALAEQAARKR